VETAVEKTTESVALIEHCTKGDKSADDGIRIRGKILGKGGKL
jgi:hypothetical protein